MPPTKTGDERWIRGKGLDGQRWHGKIWLSLVIAPLLVGPASASDDRTSQSTAETLEDLPQLDPGNQANTHKVVLITADSLSPTTVTLTPGQLIAWNSYSPSESTVVFERSVAKSMLCHSRVNFSFQEGELRSAPINAGEFASFCELKPGSYRYKVMRPTASGPAAGGDAGRMLEGEIIVGAE